MRIHAGIWLAVSAVMLVLLPPAAVAESTAPAPSVLASPDDAPATPTPPAEAPPEAAEAEEVLAEAEEIFEAADEPVAKESAPAVVDPAEEVHVTAVLRELSLRLGELAPADRRTARQILARPTRPNAEEKRFGIDYGGAPTQSTCDAPGGEKLRVCVHWVTTKGHSDAPDPELGTSGVPVWVEHTQRVFEQVWSTIVGDLRYRRPVADGNVAHHGPDDRPDVYLADLNPIGAYGYCAPEGTGGPRAASGYCVVDNDFAGYSGKPLNDLKVTAAHEFFHLVQFAYTNRMDYWVAEGTAAWVEDEVYDGINDNLQYLSRGALSFSRAPLDFVPDLSWAYSSWIWWRFLTEYVGRPDRPDPTVVRQLWNRLAANGPREQSLVALRRVLASRKKPFVKAFADFGAVNRIAPRWYDEGSRYRRYLDRPGRRHVLTRRTRLKAPAPVRLSHLANDHVIVHPGWGLAGRWRLRVVLDLPPRFRGSDASVMVHLRNGRLRTREVRLNRRGDGALTLPFNRRTVSAVAITLTNASTRIRRCGSRTAFTCGGIPLDDNLPFRYRLRVFR